MWNEPDSILWFSGNQAKGENEDEELLNPVRLWDERYEEWMDYGTETRPVGCGLRPGGNRGYTMFHPLSLITFAHFPFGLCPY